MGYRAHRLIEAKMASETNFGAIWGGFGGHFGSQIGNLGLSMRSRWHLKPIENGNVLGLVQRQEALVL